MISLFTLLYGPVAIIHGQEVKVGDYICVGDWKSKVVSIDGEYLTHANPNDERITWEKHWIHPATFVSDVYIEKGQP